MSEKQLTWADVKAGEWFKSAGGLRYLRCAGGAIRKLGNGVDAVYSNEELKSGSPYQGCHPCSPDFEIVSREEAAKRERGELQIIDERDVALESATNLANRVGEYFGEDVGEHSSINCPITNAFNLLQQSRYQAPNHSDEGEDSAGEDYVGELIEYCVKMSAGGEDEITFYGDTLRSVATKARDQYGQQQAAKRDELSIAETILKQRSEAIEKYIQAYLEKTGRKIEELEMCIQRQDDGSETYSLIPRDSDFKIKEPVPTIPQAFEELMKMLVKLNESWEKGHNVHFDSGLSDKIKEARDEMEQTEKLKQQKPTIPQEVRDALDYFYKKAKKANKATPHRDYYDEAQWDKHEAALEALKRCKPPNPHPLTKVRELVEYLGDRSVNIAAVHKYEWDNIRELLQRAGRELAEYDGEVEDE